MVGLLLTSHGRCTRLRSPVVFLPGLACTYTQLKNSLLSTSDRLRVWTPVLLWRLVKAQIAWSR